jgi:hypothetical protein
MLLENDGDRGGDDGGDLISPQGDPPDRPQDEQGPGGFLPT